MKSRILISLLVFTVLLLGTALNVFAAVPDLPTDAVSSKGPIHDKDVYDIGDLSAPVTRVDHIPETWRISAGQVSGEAFQYFSDWICGFRATFSEPLEAGTIGFYCEYSSREIAFVSSEDTGDGPVYMLGTAGIVVTYGELLDRVECFNCGVFNLSERNIGKSVTVEFVLMNPDDDTVCVIDGDGYTFRDASVLVGPWTVTLTSADTDGNEGIVTLTGGGIYQNNETATLTAPETEGYDFVGWYIGSYPSGELISILPSFEKRVNSDLDLLAVYDSSGWGVLHVAGSSYSVNGGDEQSGDGDFDIAFGASATVRYTGEDFLYWVNSSGNIVSTNRKYTFTFVGDTALRLITSRGGEIPQGMYVIFKNAYDQVLSAGRVTDLGDAEALFPKYEPGRTGSEFDRWVFEGTEDEATPESIAAAALNGGAGPVLVVPTYKEEADGQYTVKVEYTVSGWGTFVITEDTVESSEPYTVLLSDILMDAGIEADYFSYWTLDGETPASFDAEQFTVIGSAGREITVTAVFSSGEYDHPEPAVTVTGLTASKSGGRYRLSATFSFYLPEGYTLYRSGFVRSTSGEGFDEEDLVIGAEGTKVHETSFTGRSGIYTMNLNTSNSAKLFCFRAFITFADPDGGIATLYSPMVSGSYISMTGETIGDIIWD